jgi:hypothetical protein
VALIQRVAGCLPWPRGTVAGRGEGALTREDANPQALRVAAVGRLCGPPL